VVLVARGRTGAAARRGLIVLTERLHARLRVAERHVQHGPLVRVKPRDVVRRDAQIEDARWAVLEHLPMMRLLVREDDRRLVRRRWRRLRRRLRRRLLRACRKPASRDR
jgi:hypothetical protein